MTSIYSCYASDAQTVLRHEQLRADSELAGQLLHLHQLANARFGLLCTTAELATQFQQPA